MTEDDMEPDYLAQNGEPMSGLERHEWFSACTEEAKAKGITWVRFSIDDADNPTLSLVEGWKVRPKDGGEKRFQLTHAPG